MSYVYTGAEPLHETWEQAHARTPTSAPAKKSTWDKITDAAQDILVGRYGKPQTLPGKAPTATKMDDTKTAGVSTNTMLIVGGAALVAVMLVMSRRR